MIFDAIRKSLQAVALITAVATVAAPALARAEAPERSSFFDDTGKVQLTRGDRIVRIVGGSIVAVMVAGVAVIGVATIAATTVPGVLVGFAAVPMGAALLGVGVIGVNMVIEGIRGIGYPDGTPGSAVRRDAETRPLDTSSAPSEQQRSSGGGAHR